MIDTILGRCTPACGRRYFGVAANPLSLDMNQAVSLVRTVRDGCSTPIGFPSSFPMAFATSGFKGAAGPLAVCPVAGCDADNHGLVNDVDGSLFGAGTHQSLVSM